ncbi:MAG: TylF/MycF/NovP-related O-methyltransferase [Patescibacteria group bacterium]
MHFLKYVLKRTLHYFGYSLIRNSTALDFVRWANDSDFQYVYGKVKSRTLLSVDRLYVLWETARAIKAISGDVAQVGVFRGGSAELIAEAFRGNGRTVHLFDTFAGMPKVDHAIDMHQEGDFALTSLEEVKANLREYNNINFYPGTFPETAITIRDNRFAFVYIDVDIYQSTKASLEFFYPRLVRGGFMIIDDYRGKNTPGVEKALREFLHDKPEIPIVTTIAQCLVIKQ